MTQDWVRRSFTLGAAQVAIAAGAAALRPASAQTPACGGAAAANAVKKRGKLVAGVKSDYEPFGYIDAHGGLTGFDVEIVKYIAGKLGVAVDLRPVTSANRIPMLQSGIVDLLAASLTITRERVKAVDFSVPYIVIGGKFLVRKGSGIRGYADLAGKTIVITQGTPWDVKVKQQQPKAALLVLQDKPQAVQAVLQGKAAAYIDDAAPLIVFAQHDSERLQAVGDPSRPAPMGIGLRQNEAEWRNTINFALIDAWEDGTYRNLYRQFLGGDPDPCFQIYTWEL